LNGFTGYIKNRGVFEECSIFHGFYCLLYVIGYSQAKLVSLDITNHFICNY